MAQIDLPDNFPPLNVTRCAPERREPGYIAFNIRPSPAGRGRVPGGWIFIIDQAGEIQWHYESDTPVGDIRRLANGNLLCVRNDFSMVEIDRSGAIRHQWYATGMWGDKEPPANGVPVETFGFHHTANELPNGNILACSIEMREISDWPGSDEDASAPPAPAGVVGDVIVEFQPDGSIVREWKMHDLLDPMQVGYGSHGAYWEQRGLANAKDWTHVNCVFYDATDDSFIASVRHVDAIVKIGRGSGEVQWILGPPENWRAPWSDKLLRPEGALEWQYHQHDCTVTAAGTIMCFDNGCYRAKPYAPRLDPSDCYSRAVEFEVDAAAGTVRQLWAHGGPGPEGIYACYQGGTLRLPETGNTFVTFGGICTKDGVPADEPNDAFCRVVLREVTADNEVVLEIVADDSGGEDPHPYSAFRSEHLPDLFGAS